MKIIRFLLGMLVIGLIYIKSEGFGFPAGDFTFDWVSFALLLILISVIVFDPNKINRIILKHSDSELAIEMIKTNETEKILSGSEEEDLSGLEPIDIWFLYDISEKRDLELSKFNPVRKFVVGKLLKLSYVEKNSDGTKMELTERGQKVLQLASRINI